MRRRMTPEQLETEKTTDGLSLVTVIVAALLYVLLASQANAEDKGYFNCFRAGMTEAQRQEVADWFRSDGVASCCDLSDGMPGFAEDRADGVYIAPYEVVLPLAEACRDHPDQLIGEPPADHSSWIHEGGRVLHKNNPLGVVVVWWLMSYSADAQRVLWLPRCVAYLVRS